MRKSDRARKFAVAILLPIATSAAVLMAPMSAAAQRSDAPATAELNSEGIISLGGSDGSDLRVGFGISQAQATADLVTITSESPEYFRADRSGCSTTTFGATAAFFRRGLFVGYSTADRNLRSSGNVGVGSTHAELDAAHDPEYQTMEDGGVDFTVDGLRGVLRSGRIVTMAAGVYCGR